MDNLNNISEYQKIIFVNGVNEDNIQNMSFNNNEEMGIEGLSKKYPFAMIVSNTNIDDTPITNLWFDGNRLTRFIGINKNSSVRIGDHNVKLYFDNNTGLLNIYDENTLDYINVFSLFYWTSANSTSGHSDFDNVGTISSYQNKIDITFEYALNEELSGETGDIKNIPKDLTYNTSYLKKISEYPLWGTGNKQQMYKFIFEILDNTNEPIDLQFTSKYASNVNCELKNVSFELNPTDFNIYINNILCEANNSNVQISLEQNRQYTIKINTIPLNINKGKVHLNIHNNNYIKFAVETNGDIHQENNISNGAVEFNIFTTQNIPYQTIISDFLDIIVEYHLDGRTFNINKRIYFNINGVDEEPQIIGESNFGDSNNLNLTLNDGTNGGCQWSIIEGNDKFSVPENDDNTITISINDQNEPEFDSGLLSIIEDPIIITDTNNKSVTIHSSFTQNEVPVTWNGKVQVISSTGKIYTKEISKTWYPMYNPEGLTWSLEDNTNFDITPNGNQCTISLKENVLNPCKTNIWCESEYTDSIIKEVRYNIFKVTIECINCALFDDYSSEYEFNKGEINEQYPFTIEVVSNYGPNTNWLVENAQLTDNEGPGGRIIQLTNINSDIHIKITCTETLQQINNQYCYIGIVDINSTSTFTTSDFTSIKPYQIKVNYCDNNNLVTLFIYPDTWGSPVFTFNNEDYSNDWNNDQANITIPNGYSYKWWSDDGGEPTFYITWQ